jgi:cytochrome c biogenesis protein CcdA/thiol-disulfide isomerase/thioredoxin
LLLICAKSSSAARRGIQEEVCMVLAILVFLGGMLTILSPCILPVLPFVFARAEQPFLRSGLPLLLGMALTFAAVATLAAVGGSWAVHINQYGRGIALVLLAAFAVTLLSRHAADWLARPFVALGNRLTKQDPASNSSAGSAHSLLLGVATGLLWAPCAGPILGLVLTGAALSGPNVHTTLLLFAYAAGSATSLAIALLAGGRIFAAMKRSLGAGEWVRRALGVAVLIAVAAIAFGWDSGVLTRLSLASTGTLEQSLITKIAPPNPIADAVKVKAGSFETGSRVSSVADAAPSQLPIEGQLPSLAGATAWLNSPPLTQDSLRGKVVVVDFWTYSCINCLRSLPFVKAWYTKYKDFGLVVIGVHAPEFAFEKDFDNVRHAVHDLGITYPVALDNNYAIWRGFDNQYWPAHYFIDAQGRIRAHHFGEGEYDKSEEIIRQLLAEVGVRNLPQTAAAALPATGVQVAADDADVGSPETYVGYDRAEHFAAAPAVTRDGQQSYSTPSTLKLNQWGLAGTWTVDKEKATLDRSPGQIVFRFHARDLHLVLGPGAEHKPIRFRVTLDGAAPAANHGGDIDSSGSGVVHEQRLYQLIRQSGDVSEHTFTIEFQDAGVQAYAFTFG